MIPGPVEISPAVRAAYEGPPPGHLAPDLIEAFGSVVERMRRVWKAPAEAQPFVVAGSGTLAMEIAASNLLGPDRRALVVNTGYFSQRMAEILRRYGVDASLVGTTPGAAVSLDEIEARLKSAPVDAVFVTHVDTSTGVRMDAQAVAGLAHASGAMTVVDGVCATGAEALDMSDGSVDVYLTGSQKALGLPPGLALLVMGPRALEARRSLREAPPMYLDIEAWQPIMDAYEQRKPAYFATPATNLIKAAAVGLKELEEDRFGGQLGVDARVRRHAHVACAMQGAWEALGLEHLCETPRARGYTMSALRYPKDVGPELVPKIAERGVIVAGGLYPDLKSTYFRVGHMGWCTTQPDILRATVEAVGGALASLGWAQDVDAAVSSLLETLESPLETGSH